MRLVRLPLLVTILAACGGGGDGGTPPGRTPASVSVAVSSTAPMTALGHTRTLTAEVRDASQQVIPNAAVTWARDVNDKVTLSSTTGLTTVATAAANGSVNITATSGSITSNSVTLVVQQALNSVTVSPPAPTVFVNTTRDLTAAGLDANNNAITNAGQAQFTSSNTGVATVAATGTASGRVTGVAEGTATITASYTVDGVTKSANATVTVQPLQTSADVSATTANAFEPPRVDIAAGGTVRWVWSSVAHNVQFQTPGAPASIGGANTSTTDPAGTTRTFPNAGTFNYQCGIHVGMNGSVVVH